MSASDSSDHPTAEATPYVLLGGEARTRELARRFYDAMERLEPELTALHLQGEPGRVHPEARERFTLFLIGWLGGPQDYVARHGHPRLRMRHARVPIGTDMRDAWLRCMRVAMDECAVQPPLRAFLEQRFLEVADFMRNREGA